MSTTSPLATSSSTTSLSAATTTIPAGGSSKSTPPSATLLFGFLVIFVALFAAFILLAFFWRYQRHRHLQAMLRVDEIKATIGGVPKLWEVCVLDGPGGNQWEWESVRPLSIDVDRELSGRAIPPTPRSRRFWPRNLFHRRSVPPPSSQAEQQLDSAGAGASADVSARLLAGATRMSFIVAMPHADMPNRRRSEISQLSRVGENWRRREYAIGVYHPHCRGQ